MTKAPPDSDREPEYRLHAEEVLAALASDGDRDHRGRAAERVHGLLAAVACGTGCGGVASDALGAPLARSEEHEFPRPESRRHRLAYDFGASASQT
ncbi:MAG TPA: hypothetical protein VHK24_13545 [Steroidobacter sp.]|nr:hypothetical protein [Steroidobacter sp.]